MPVDMVFNIGNCNPPYEIDKSLSRVLPKGLETLVCGKAVWLFFAIHQTSLGELRNNASFRPLTRKAAYWSSCLVSLHLGIKPRK